MTNHDTHYGTEDHPIELKPNSARAGRKDVPVLYVLVSSTVLAVVVLAAIFFGFHAMVH